MYIAGVARLFCSRANIQQINSTAGQKHIFFSMLISRNTLIYGDFIQNIYLI
jgi:hypothetical protein